MYSCSYEARTAERSGAGYLALAITTSSITVVWEPSIHVRLAFLFELVTVQYLD
jgi:hypothetical protein